MNVVGQHEAGLTGLLDAGKQLAARRMATGDWLSGIRARAVEQVSRLPVPDRSMEAWRYTPIGFLGEADYRPLDEQGDFDALQLGDIEELLLGDQTVRRLVFVNGRFAPALSTLAALGSEVEIACLSGALAEPGAELRAGLDSIADSHHLFAALNSALMSDGALIRVPAGTQSEQPLELLHLSIGMDEPAVCHPRHLVLVEDGARAHVIERYCSLGDAVYFNNAIVEVSVGEGSDLVHERLQEESARAQHLADLHVRVARAGRYRQTLAALGGQWSRNDVRITLAGEGGDAQFDALLLARDKQLNDLHLDIRHEAPGCTSRETVKGVLDGAGRVVFDGRVLVAKDAQHTDAVLSNHNLMLSRSAEVDTKPQLEIYADDVKCSHGTTVGELDRNMLFYLRSRGIPAALARQMLCRGFAEDVLGRYQQPAMRARAERLLQARLAIQ